MTSQTLSPRVLAGAIVFLATVIGISVVCILNIRGAQWPSERRYLIWTTATMWIMLLVALALMAVLDAPWRFVVLGSYFILLPAFIYRVSLRRQMIREYEERHAHAREAKPPES